MVDRWLLKFRSAIGPARWCAVIALAAVFALGGERESADAEGSIAPGVVVYAGCDSAIGTAPSHVCHKGDELGAFIRSDNDDLVYTVCFEIPHRKRACAKEQEATRDTLFVNTISSSAAGKARIYWYANSVEIGRWEVTLFHDPIVPKFGVNPLIVAGSHRLAGLLVKHVPSGMRVRAWRSCTGVCGLPLRLKSSHGGNRLYLITAHGSTFKLGTLVYVQVDAPGKREHGFRVWGRVFTGTLVRNSHGSSADTAIRRVGPLLCSPPGTSYGTAINCDRVS